MSFSNGIFCVRSACILFALFEIFEYTTGAQRQYSGISDIKVEWKNKGTKEKEKQELKNLFGIIFLIYHMNAGLNVIGIFISSSLLYGVIREKQQFLSPILYFFPFDVILRAVLMITLLFLKLPDLDPITTTVGYVFTVLFLNLTWVLTVVYKQQLQKQEKEKLA